ncbi:hypothetical protein NKH18_27335 [Streptomyces sp. M10(2022)]
MDVTYADRVRAYLTKASEARAVEDVEAEGLPAAHGVAVDETEGGRPGAVDVLLREQDSGSWGQGRGPATCTSCSPSPSSGGPSRRGGQLYGGPPHRIMQERTSVNSCPQLAVTSRRPSLSRGDQCGGSQARRTRTP